MISCLLFDFRVVGDHRMCFGLRTNHHSLITNHQRLFGGHKAVVRPDPIPNSAVKHSLADGSGCIASARVGCRQMFFGAGTKIPALLLGMPDFCEDGARCRA